MKRLIVAGAILASVVPGRALFAQTRAFGLDDLGRVVRVSDPQISPDGRSIAVVIARANFDEDRWDAELATVDIATGAVRQVTYDRRGVGFPRWSPDGDRLAFLATDGTGHDAHPQIFVMHSSGGEARRLTTVTTGVQQYAWSPDGVTVAFAAADEAEKRPDSEKFNDSFEIENDDFLVTKAPTPTHVWVVPSAGGTARRITSGSWSLPVSFPPGAPSSPIAWSPDGKSIAISKVVSPHSGDRGQSQVAIADVASGAVKPLTGATKFEGYPTFSPDGTRIAYWYPRDGDRANVTEVHLVGGDGGAGRSLTRAIDRHIARAIWMPDGRSLLVGGNDGTHVSLWIQPVDGPSRRLNIGPLTVASSFWVDVNVGRNGAIAFVASDPSRPAELYYMTSFDAAPKRLTDLNHDVAALALGRTERIDWQSDGFSHNGILTYPPNFTAGQKYPLVLVIHGGPRAASLENFSAQAQLMAAKGWVVFQPNYRGSDQNGSAYQHAIFNDAGDGPGRDVMAGVAAVKSRGFVDESKIAVSGWSYGGYMTSWLLGHYSGWRVAVAGAPVTDWLDQYNLSDGNVAGGGSFGGSPWTGNYMAAYIAQSPITYASKIKTPTLVMQNTGDFRVTVTQGYKLYHALRDNGIETKFVGYPIPGHNAADPVRQRDVQRRWIGWIEQHFATGRPSTDQP